MKRSEKRELKTRSVEITKALVIVSDTVFATVANVTETELATVARVSAAELGAVAKVIVVLVAMRHGAHPR